MMKNLVSAAEKLHYNFEMMMRIRPAIKELYDYHQILYIIYHKLFPEKYDEIEKLMDGLIKS
jgi:hypothetical protein